jgi:drug/metabolite transporter (DMT)-like permease
MLGPAYRRMPPALRGMMFMFIASLSGVFMHATVRSLSDELRPFELAFFRNFLALIILSIPLLRLGLKPLHSRRRGLHLLRGVLTTASMLAFFTALSMTPLAQVTALAFTAPLFATVLAIIFLGEVVRLRRWIAILIGFAGTVVILRPGVEAIDLGAGLTLFSAATWGAAIIVTRILGRSESSHTITLYMALIMTVLSFVPATTVWIWPSLDLYFWLFLMAAFGTVTQLCFTQSLREAETSVVLPIDFLKLIWATAIGYVLFSELPDATTLFGGAMIFASAIYIAYRESRLSRSKIVYQK